MQGVAAFPWAVQQIMKKWRRIAIRRYSLFA
jgi:hypothetical protein